MLAAAMHAPFHPTPLNAHACVIAGLEQTLAELAATEATAGRLCSVLSHVGSSGRPALFNSPRLEKLSEGIVALAPHLRDRVPTSRQLGRILARLQNRSARLDGVLKRINSRLLCGERLWRIDLVQR